MAGIYSKNLLSLQGLDGAWTSPAVEVGLVVVLRDVDIYWNGLGEAGFYLIGEAGQTIWWTGWGVADAGTAKQWRGRQVIEAGQTWGVHTDQPIDVTVSGYVLVGS